MKISDQALKMAVDSRSNSKVLAVRTYGLCLNCGYEGTPKVKSSKNLSAKELGAFGTCFPLCFMVFVRYVRRHQVVIMCAQCKAILGKIKHKKKWWQV